MSKTYVSQQFFNNRHKIYPKKVAFLYTEPKKLFFYSNLRPKNALYVKGFVISNIYINISFKTGFRRFYQFLIEKNRQKKNLAYFCNFKPDVFYFRTLGHIGAKLRGGSYVNPPCTNRVAKYFGTDRVNKVIAILRSILLR